MKLTDIRRAKLRELIEKEGASKLSTTLGYRQPTFLSQLAGPKPTRDITEKSARRFEKDLGLPEGWFDHMEQPAAAPAAAAPVDTAAVTVQVSALVGEAIRQVGSICVAEGVELPPVKFTDIVAMAYMVSLIHI